MKTSTAQELDLGDSLVENLDETKEEAKEEKKNEVDAVTLMVDELRNLGVAQAEKDAAEKAKEDAEAKEQKALERLYDLTDEGDRHILLPNGTYRVRKKRGRATGFEFVQVEKSNTVDLSDYQS